jgi:uncharacterized protein YjbI with pentapeptide repeats
VLKNKDNNKTKSFFDELETKYNLNIYKKFLKGGDFVSDRPKKKLVTSEDIIKNKNNVIALSQMMSKSAFNEVEFLNLSFSGITMIRTAFVFSDLRGSDFSKTVLKKCDFSFANLQNCNFSNAIMIDCIFRHANMRNANFTATDTLFCDFTHADF